MDEKKGKVETPKEAVDANIELYVRACAHIAMEEKFKAIAALKKIPGDADARFYPIGTFQTALEQCSAADRYTLLVKLAEHRKRVAHPVLDPMLLTLLQYTEVQDALHTALTAADESGCTILYFFDYLAYHVPSALGLFLAQERFCDFISLSALHGLKVLETLEYEQLQRLVNSRHACAKGVNGVAFHGLILSLDKIDATQTLGNDFLSTLTKIGHIADYAWKFGAGFELLKYCKRYPSMVPHLAFHEKCQKTMKQGGYKQEFKKLLDNLSEAEKEYYWGRCCEEGVDYFEHFLWQLVKEPDMVRADAYYQRAAKLGNSDAIARLNAYFEQAEGIRRSSDSRQPAVREQLTTLYEKIPEGSGYFAEAQGRLALLLPQPESPRYDAEKMHGALSGFQRGVTQPTPDTPRRGSCGVVTTRFEDACPTPSPPTRQNSSPGLEHATLPQGKGRHSSTPAVARHKFKPKSGSNSGASTPKRRPSSPRTLIAHLGPAVEQLSERAPAPPPNLRARLEHRLFSSMPSLLRGKENSGIPTPSS